MYRKLILSASFIGVFLLLTNALASLFYWYISMPWFDMAMHTVGGIFVSLLAGSLFAKQIKFLPKVETSITIMLFVFIVVLLWEYYEYTIQIFIKNVHLADIADSIVDVICGMIGGAFGTYLVILTKKRYNSTNGITPRT